MAEKIEHIEKEFLDFLIGCDKFYTLNVKKDYIIARLSNTFISNNFINSLDQLEYHLDIDDKCFKFKRAQHYKF